MIDLCKSVLVTSLKCLVALMISFYIIDSVAFASLGNANSQEILLIQRTGLMLEPTASPTILPPAILPPPSPLTHTIKAGEILWHIARTYSATVEAIMTANHITDPKTLQIGQVLVIPTVEASPSPAASSSPVIEYTIKSGDTLLALALACGTTVEAILALNPGLEPTLLQIGQQIVIPRERATLTTTAQSRPVIATPVFSAGLTVLEQAVLKAVNDERAAQGLAAYASDEVLTNVARGHAQDMVIRDYFSHVTPEGKTLRDRLREAGVEKHWVGENIQRNTHPAGKTVQMAMVWFMDSAPHRNNILAPEYTRLGVGLVEGPPGWYTFVLVFAGET